MKIHVIAFTLLILACVISFPAFATEICGKWDYLSINGGEYMAQNNIWGASTAQCINVNGTSFTVTRSEHNMSTSGSPAAYPSLFKGCHWEDCTNNSGMPIQVSQIQSAVINWSNTLVGSGAYNVTTEAWFKTNATPGDPDGAELMIWINHMGSVQPGGSRIGSASIGGYTWDVWFNQIGWNFITYKITSPTTSVTLDYKPFIQDAMSRGYIQNSWYMMDVEAGFEIWQGGTGLALNSFSCSVNQGSITPEPTSAPAITPDPTATPGGMRGDVNGDGRVDVVDALIMSQCYVGLHPQVIGQPDPCTNILADVNCSGNLDIVDALLVAQFYVGLISQFPC